MGLLSSIESFLERLFEAPIGRLFGTKIQPVTLAKRIERAMDTNKTFGADGILVPNRYEIHLHPTDYAAFESYRGSLEDDLAHRVLTRAREERYTLVARPRVELHPDDGTPRGDLRIAANLVDDRGAALRPGRRPRADASDTMVFDRPDRRAAEPPRSASRAYLLVNPGAGRPIRFDLGGPLISIGRGADNDLILDDGQVSRHHCQLKLQQGAYSLADLGSMNGSYVNGQRVDEIALGPGDLIQVGDTRIEFQVGR